MLAPLGGSPGCVQGFRAKATPTAWVVSTSSELGRRSLWGPKSTVSDVDMESWCWSEGGAGSHPPDWAPDSPCPRPPASLPGCTAPERTTAHCSLHSKIKVLFWLGCPAGSGWDAVRSGLRLGPHPTQLLGWGFLELGGESSATEEVAGGQGPGRLTLAPSLLLDCCRSGGQAAGARGQP